MTMAYPVELLQAAASVEDCGHLVEKRFTDSGGRERCSECERERKRDYDARRAKRDRSAERARGPRVIRERELRADVVRLHLVEETPQRPRTRAECAEGPRPCPWVGCRYNLWSDVTEAGSLRVSFPGVEPEDMPPTGSCALDVADSGPQEGHVVGAYLNVVRERVRQIENEALEKLSRVAELRDHLE